MRLCFILGLVEIIKAGIRESFIPTVANALFGMRNVNWSWKLM